MFINKRNKVLNIIFGIILIVYSYFLYLNFGYGDNGIMLYFLMIIILPIIIVLYFIILFILNKKWKLLLGLFIGLLFIFIVSIIYEKYEHNKFKIKLEEYRQTKDFKKSNLKNKYQEKYIEIKYDVSLTEEEKIIEINKIKDSFDYNNLYAN